jgi:hypothetical protein
MIGGAIESAEIFAAEPKISRVKRPLIRNTV